MLRTLIKTARSRQAKQRTQNVWADGQELGPLGPLSGSWVYQPLALRHAASREDSSLTSDLSTTKRPACRLNGTCCRPGKCIQGAVLVKWCTAFPTLHRCAKQHVGTQHWSWVTQCADRLEARSFVACTLAKRCLRITVAQQKCVHVPTHLLISLLTSTALLSALTKHRQEQHEAHEMHIPFVPATSFIIFIGLSPSLRKLLPAWHAFTLQLLNVDAAAGRVFETAKLSNSST